MIFPKLRFRGFNKQYFINKLKNISSYVSGTALEKYFNPKGIYKVISIGSYGLNHKYIDQGIRAVPSKKVLSKRLSCGDLAMNLNDRNTKHRGQTLGNTLLISDNDRYVINQRSERIIPNHNQSSLFLYFYLNSPQFKKRLISIAQGDTQMYMKWKDVNNLTVIMPSLSEQRLIGRFFAKLDKLINLQQAKCSLLKKQKRGYLQKLFPEKDKLIPRFRFDGFHNSWKVCKLSNLTEVKDGTHSSPKKLSKGYPLITSKNLGNGCLNDNDISYISRKDYDKINQRSNVSVGDILFGMIGTIGSPVLMENECNFAIKNVALIKKSLKIYNLWLLALLNSNVFKRYIHSVHSGSTQNFIGLNVIRNFQFPIPSLAEQQEIGRFFKRLDDNINLQNNKLNYLRKLKKAYLQKMFC